MIWLHAREALQYYDWAHLDIRSKGIQTQRRAVITTEIYNLIADQSHTALETFGLLVERKLKKSEKHKMETVRTGYGGKGGGCK